MLAAVQPMGKSLAFPCVHAFKHRFEFRLSVLARVDTILGRIG